MRKVFKNNSKKIIFSVFVSIFIILLILFFAIYTYLKPYQPEQKYLDIAYSNPNISIVEYNDYYEISPKKIENKNGIIFYPGGLVSADSYIYKMSEIAEEISQRIFISKLTLNLAALDQNSASNIIDSENDIEKWEIWGHSLGGVFACRFANNNQDKIDKVILMASYCDTDISNSKLNTITIYGSNDTVLNVDELNNNQSNLPESRVVVEIDGMNHAQFGNYGEQDGDGAGEIGDEELIGKIVELLSYD